MLIKNDYIDLETAILLNMLDFDWETKTYTTTKDTWIKWRLFGEEVGEEQKRGSVFSYSGYLGANHIYQDCVIKCPEQSVVQKWLREEKGMIITIEWFDRNGQFPETYSYIINCPVDFERSGKNMHDVVIYKNERNIFRTYEDALMFAIKECLEILTSKKDK